MPFATTSTSQELVPDPSSSSAPEIPYDQTENLKLVVINRRFYPGVVHLVCAAAEISNSDSQSAVKVVVLSIASSKTVTKENWYTEGKAKIIESAIEGSSENDNQIQDTGRDKLRSLKRLVKLGDSLQWTDEIVEQWREIQNKTLVTVPQPISTSNPESNDDNQCHDLDRQKRLRSTLHITVDAVKVETEMFWTTRQALAVRDEENRRAEGKKVKETNSKNNGKNVNDDHIQTTTKSSPPIVNRKLTPLLGPDVMPFITWLLEYGPMAEFLKRRFSESNSNSNPHTILDVAGGRGDLSFSLLTHESLIEKTKNSESSNRSVRVCLVDPKKGSGRMTPSLRRNVREKGVAIDEVFLERFEVVDPSEEGGNSDSNLLGGNELNDSETLTDLLVCQPVPNSEYANSVSIDNNSPVLLKHPPLNALARSSSLILGLHPDQATDHIVDFAIAHRIPFAVVPCCVFGREFLKTRPRVHTREQLIEWLVAKGASGKGKGEKGGIDIKTDVMHDYDGANVVVYCTFESSVSTVTENSSSESGGTVTITNV